MNPNPYSAPNAKHWKMLDASTLGEDRTFECDVAIVGTGAGGGTAAEILARSGLRVLMLEEGPLRTSSDFHMLEREAYPNLYQESAGRRTKDEGIIILQGRSVGGSTTVNWTSSFRTPPETLAYWRAHFALDSFTPAALAPWFAMMERRLGIHRWEREPNDNNDVLRRGAARIGVPTKVIPRNVRGCYNLGYCGLGCPTNAKQSMLITTIPAALAHGAQLVSRVRAERFVHAHGAVGELLCSALDAAGLAPGPHTIRVRARAFIAAGGAINTPALLIRSALLDPESRIGKRTFLHPTVISAATMPEEVVASSGAPQSIYSDHFLKTQAIDGPIGYKLEVPPLQPVLTASTFTGLGEFAASQMRNFNHLQAIIALMRDGFNEESVGGTVDLHSDGTPVLDYPISGFVWDGMRRALLAMAEIQFAAGARTVYPLHESAVPYGSWAEARAAIAQLPMEILRTRVASAHVMGGSAMSKDERTGVVDQRGRSHALENLYVFDGSAFPTSLGANPQLSIYGMVARNASALAESLTGRPAAPLADADNAEKFTPNGRTALIAESVTPTVL